MSHKVFPLGIIHHFYYLLFINDKYLLTEYSNSLLLAVDKIIQTIYFINDCVNLYLQSDLFNLITLLLSFFFVLVNIIGTVYIIHISNKSMYIKFIIILILSNRNSTSKILY